MGVGLRINELVGYRDTFGKLITGKSWDNKVIAVLQARQRSALCALCDGDALSEPRPVWLRQRPLLQPPPPVVAGGGRGCGGGGGRGCTKQAS